MHNTHFLDPEEKPKRVRETLHWLENINIISNLEIIERVVNIFGTKSDDNAFPNE